MTELNRAQWREQIHPPRQPFRRDLAPTIATQVGGY